MELPNVHVPKAMLAPMEGVTNPVYRQWVSESLDCAPVGLDTVCTEFVRITKHTPNEKVFREAIQRPKHQDIQLSVQVMGKHIEHMRDAAELLVQKDIDIIDINLGCPTPRAARGGVGAQMLEDMDTLKKVLTEMRSVIPGMLSAKMRAGVTESALVLERAQILEDCGIDFLVIHPRRTIDAYTGCADWRITAEVAKVLSIPVIANGDGWYPTDVLRLLDITGCHGYMCGRSSMRNPFLFDLFDDLLKGKSPRFVTVDMLLTRLHVLILRYIESVSERYALGRLKEIGRWVMTTVPTSKEQKRSVLQEQTTDLVFQRLAEHLTIQEKQLGPIDAQAASTHRLMPTPTMFFEF